MLLGKPTTQRERLVFVLWSAGATGDQATIRQWQALLDHHGDADMPEVRRWTDMKIRQAQLLASVT